MDNKNKEALVEGLRELVRTIVIATIPLVIVGFQEGTIDWKPIWVGGLIALLRAVDKWAHEKDVKPFGVVGIEHKGLVPV